MNIKILEIELKRLIFNYERSIITQINSDELRKVTKQDISYLTSLIRKEKIKKLLNG